MKACKVRFQAIDITGGAPEMVPDLSFLIEGLAPLAPRLMLRTNLAALAAPAREGLLTLCIARRVVLVASFPSTNPSRTDTQRGTGVAEAGIAMLRKLNAAGYGVEGSGLELNLVSNPVGAFLPACDFNLATDRYLEGRKAHVSEIRRQGNLAPRQVPSFIFTGFTPASGSNLGPVAQSPSGGGRAGRAPDRCNNCCIGPASPLRALC